MFASYPSGVIGADSVVALADGANEARLGRIRKLGMNDFAAAFLAPAGDMVALLRRLDEGGPATAANLLAAAPEQLRPLLHRSLGWLAKMGLVRITPVPTGSQVGRST